MTWHSKVIWSEGMFLRPQHFQQQDRYLEALIRGRCGPLRPYDWGVEELALDREALALGKLAIAVCRGLLPDGTPISIPDSDDPPPPLDIAAEVRDSRVLLALPLRRLGMPEVERDAEGETTARYRAVPWEVRDSNLDTAGNVAPVEIGKRRLRLILDSGERGDYTGIGIARVRQKRPDQTVELDESYIPPALSCRAIPPLNGFINEILGLLRQRADALAERLLEPGPGRGVEIVQFLRLQVANRFDPLFVHLAEMTGLHPEDFYRIALQLAGEMATFNVRTRRRAAAFPAYDHDDLQATFAPLLAALRQSLSLVEEQVALQIPLEERSYGIRVGLIDNRIRPLLARASFILAVRADLSADALRERFPSQVTVGPVERIAPLVNSHLPGIGLSQLPVAPREIPYQADFSYFRLDRGSELWKQLLNSGGFAFHVAGDFPNIELVFWAIKE